MHGIEAENRWAGPLTIVALVLLVVVMLRSPQQTFTTPPQALENLAAPATLSGQFAVQAAPTLMPVKREPIAGHDEVARTGLLTLYTSAGSYSADQVQAIAEPLAEALTYVSERTSMQLNGPVAIIFDRRDNCGLDGAAYTQKRIIYLYTCSNTPVQRAVNILAHEFVHQLAHDHYGEAHLQADMILSEGLATWGAGKYWLGSEPTFHAFVRRHYAASLLPLDSDYRAIGTIDAMNRLYYQWASLVDFVIEKHGRASFDQLYTSGRGMSPNTADYDGVIGMDIEAIQHQWQAWLAQ